MSTFDRQSQGAYTVAGSRAEAGIDQGLRAYMLGVYNYMTIGLALTGFFALGISMLATTTDQASAVAQLGNGKMLTQLGVALYGSPLKWVVMLATLGIVMWLSDSINSMSSSSARNMFFLYAASFGVALSSIFLVYTPGSIVQVFFITVSIIGLLRRRGPSRSANAGVSV